MVTFVFEDKEKWAEFIEIIQSDNNLKEEYDKVGTGDQKIHLIGDLHPSRRGFPPVTRSMKLVCRSRNLHSQELAKPQRTTYIIHDKHKCFVLVLLFLKLLLRNVVRMIYFFLSYTTGSILEY